MVTEILLREFIAVSQASGQEGDPKFGRGFNYRVEISAALMPDLQGEALLRGEFRRALSEIDHACLGVDKGLGPAPHTSELCKFLISNLKVFGVTSVTMERGDGFFVSATAAGI